MENKLNSQSHKKLNIIGEESPDSLDELTRIISEELIPNIALSAFRFGEASNKERLRIKKISPESYEFLIENIEKGKKLRSSSLCTKCDTTHSKEDSFCGKCGNNLKK